MANPLAVKMGVCNVEFGEPLVDLGYTSGGIKCTYKAETLEKTVDQEDAPIDEIITKQNFEVQVPLAEQNLEMLASILPGAVYTAGSGGGSARLTLSGSAGGSLLTMARKLVLKPAGGTTEDWVTVHYAIPVPEMEFAFEKEKVRVYNVTFKAMRGANGWVTFGDETPTTP